MITMLAGFGAAYALSVILFGTFILPFVPFMPNPDPAHQLLYTVFPLAFSAPLVIKRQHDRNRSPMFFILYMGLAVGFLLFGASGSTATYPITQAELSAFVAKHVVHAPVTLMGLWLFIECSFLKGVRGPNQYGNDPLDREADGSPAGNTPHTIPKDPIDPPAAQR